MKDNKKELNVVTGAAFDDMSIDEMAEVQGAGDVEGEVTTPVCAVAVTASLSIQVAKTLKGKC
ncbi:MAG: lichenicidin A2 family type 2 lantibiotic [Staphylococcus aureus]